MQTLVVIPTYNEADNLKPLVEYLLGLDMDMGILVVDDASPDGTGRIADSLAASYPQVTAMHRQGKLGLGSAYVQGFGWGLANTGAEVMVQMDADFSHDPLVVPQLVEQAQKGRVGIGSRYVPGGGVKNWGLGRRMLSRSGCLYARAILGLPINDVTGGFKAWPREVLQAIALDRVRSDGYGFQAEMSYLAYRLGFDLKEVPITFVDRRVGQSKMTCAIAMEALFVVWWLRLGRKNCVSP